MGTPNKIASEALVGEARSKVFSIYTDAGKGSDGAEAVLVAVAWGQC